MKKINIGHWLNGIIYPIKNKLLILIGYIKSKIVGFFMFLNTKESSIDQWEVYLLSGIGFVTYGVAQFGGPYSFIVCGILLIALGLLILWRTK